MDTQTLIQEISRKFSYDPETGLFIRTKQSRGLPVGSAVTTDNGNGYVTINLFGKCYKAHRLAWLVTYGEMPEMIDHINGNKSDNRICNLRPASAEINQQNKRKPSDNNRSGYLGVCWCKQINRFKAQIKKDGKVTYLGTFTDAEEAHNAYLDAKRSIHAGCTI